MFRYPHILIKYPPKKSLLSPKHPQNIQKKQKKTTVTKKRNISLRFQHDLCDFIGLWARPLTSAGRSSHGSSLSAFLSCWGHRNHGKSWWKRLYCLVIVGKSDIIYGNNDIMVDVFCYYYCYYYLPTNSWYSYYPFLFGDEPLFWVILPNHRWWLLFLWHFFV